VNVCVFRCVSLCACAPPQKMEGAPWQGFSRRMAQGVPACVCVCSCVYVCVCSCVCLCVFLVVCLYVPACARSLRNARETAGNQQAWGFIRQQVINGPPELYAFSLMSPYHTCTRTYIHMHTHMQTHENTHTEGLLEPSTSISYELLMSTYTHARMHTQIYTHL